MWQKKKKKKKFFPNPNSNVNRFPSGSKPLKARPQSVVGKHLPLLAKLVDSIKPNN
jgi:hypothetical protein